MNVEFEFPWGNIPFLLSKEHTEKATILLLRDGGEDHECALNLKIMLNTMESIVLYSAFKIDHGGSRDLKIKQILPSKSSSGVL